MPRSVARFTALGARVGRSWREVEDAARFLRGPLAKVVMALAVAAALLVPIVATATPAVAATIGTQFGNTSYVNFNFGETYSFQGHVIRLESCVANACNVAVDGDSRELVVAQRALPTVISGVRVFLADNRAVANVTSNTDFPLTHALTTGDALLGISDPALPLVDTAWFTFPIDLSHGFKWSMEEASYIFAFRNPTRARRH